jgi:glycosyltransferase involved in cell wall biosynthesis
VLPHLSLGYLGLPDLRLAVITPFLDRRHGTELCIVEQLERISRQQGIEVHVYSQRVDDLSGAVRYPGTSTPGAIFWHKVRSIPGPHLFAYLWWFLANRVQRVWDSRIRGLEFDVLYSPGVNAFDADAIAVHIVFHEFYAQVKERLKFRGNSFSSWPRLLHRRIYYHLIMGLERRVYRRRATSLAGVSTLVADQLAKHFQRTDVCVIRHGVDTGRFSPAARVAGRDSARARWLLQRDQFVLLLIGNDFRKKGLDTLIHALAACRDLPLRLLVVGTDERKGYEALIQRSGMADRILFLEPSADVLQFYAAADAYVGPSLEDAYGLPILEAMACGLPVVASSRAGASELIHDGKNGMLLRNPDNPEELAGILRALYTNQGLSQQLGHEACSTAQSQSWDHNAAQTWEFLKAAATRKSRSQQ